MWSVAEGKALSSLSDCIDLGVCPCVFYDDSNKVASAQLGKVVVSEVDIGRTTGGTLDNEDHWDQ